ncbi:MAG: hypothetical protein WCD76_14860 [Pyrinomonadaceae bacterium]
MARLEDLMDSKEMERAARGQVPFEASPFYEKLMQLRESNPQAFASMSPASKLALGYYEGAKRRHALMLDKEEDNLA